MELLIGFLIGTIFGMTIIAIISLKAINKDEKTLENLFIKYLEVTQEKDFKEIEHAEIRQLRKEEVKKNDEYKKLLIKMYIIVTEKRTRICCRSLRQNKRTITSLAHE